MAISKAILALLVALSALQAVPVSAQSSAHGEHAAARSPVNRGAQAWTTAPMLQVAGRPGEQGRMPFGASGMQPESVQVFGPLAPAFARPVAREQGRWMVVPDEGGGFHWIEALQHQAGQVLRATTLWSFSGKGSSPEKLLQRQAEGLEIRPLRVPERGGYRESSAWDFRVLFDGKPLAGHEVELQTENGSRQTFKSDPQGVVRIIFPRDFSAESIDPDQGAARTRKAYLLVTNWQHEAVDYRSSFSYFYTPDLMRERSVVWGLGFMALGMLIAVPLLRRRKGV